MSIKEGLRILVVSVVLLPTHPAIAEGAQMERGNVRSMPCSSKCAASSSGCGRPMRLTTTTIVTFHMLAGQSWSLLTQDRVGICLEKSAQYFPTTVTARGVVGYRKQSLRYVTVTPTICHLD
jgi:hypothetical protein